MNAFKCLRRVGYINSVMTINNLIDRSDYELFKKACSASHSLHRLLPLYRTLVICVCVVIPSSCLNIILICIKIVNCSISV